MRIKLKHLLPLIILCLCWFQGNAKKVPGFIISKSNDTVHGKIEVSNFDRYTGGWIINNIDWEWCCMQVKIKQDGNSKTNTYLPQDINGYGFYYKQDLYAFKSFELIKQSLIKKEGVKPVFMLLLNKGDISLYKYMTNIAFEGTGQSHKSYDYYLYSLLYGLTMVEPTKQVKTLRELLLAYHFPDAFVKSIPEDTPFKSIGSVLIHYELWQKDRDSRIKDI